MVPFDRAEIEIRRLEIKPVLQVQSQMPGGNFKAAFQFLPCGAAAQFAHAHFRHICAEPGNHIAQIHINGKLGNLAIMDTQPAAQRPPALAELTGQIQPGSPCGHVGVIEPGKQHAAPPGQIVETGTVKLSAHIQRGCQVCGRQRLKRKPVPVEEVRDAQVYLLQHQRRRIALLIHPDNQRIAHDQVGLVQQPVGYVVVFAFSG